MMRELTNSEHEAMERAWKVHLADDPELASFVPFEAGFISGLDTALRQAVRPAHDGAQDETAEQLAALQAAPFDELRTQLRQAQDTADGLRAALAEIAAGNPAPPGGKWLSDAKMAQIARKALEGSDG